jgi:hypothetical protein
MKKSSIPAVPLGSPNKEALDAIKQNLDTITGVANTRIKKLDAEVATVVDVVKKINEILDLLQ